MYTVYNNNLLMHGCVPTNKDGTFTNVCIKGSYFCGKKLYDKCNELVKIAFQNHDKYAIDFLWYLWCGKDSPLFGRDAMKTYETYFLGKNIKEVQNSYYDLVKNEEFCDKILNEFDVQGKYCHIINGHVPVQRVAGESPVKCNGKLIIIDGGFSKAYQSKTGIAGYTLVYNSHGMRLIAHMPFESKESAIINETDIYSDVSVLETSTKRVLVANTDTGILLADQIEQLQKLLESYENGTIVEK